MHTCLLCAANNMERGSWLQIHYNSVRADNKKVREGKVYNIEMSRYGDKKVEIRRPDDQTMEIHSNGKVVSHRSSYPLTGYFYKLKVEKPTPKVPA